MTPLNDETKLNLNSSLTEWSQIVPSNMPWIANDRRNVMQCYGPLHPLHPLHHNLNLDHNPSVVQFSGICAPNHTNHNLYSNTNNHQQYVFQNMCRKPVKRSNDCIEDEFETDINRRPIKHHITEDKVAAIFDNLRIDESSAKSGQSLSDDIDECADEHSIDFDSDSNFNKRSQLVITDEVQNAFAVEDVTNKLIKDEFDKLSKAVVVWTPQFSHIRDHVFGTQTDNQDECESSSDQNASKDLSINADLSLNNEEELEFMPIEEIDNEMEFCT